MTIIRYTVLILFLLTSLQSQCQIIDNSQLSIKSDFGNDIVINWELKHFPNGQKGIYSYELTCKSNTLFKNKEEPVYGIFQIYADDHKIQDSVQLEIGTNNLSVARYSFKTKEVIQKIHLEPINTWIGTKTKQIEICVGLEDDYADLLKYESTKKLTDKNQEILIEALPIHPRNIAEDFVVEFISKYNIHFGGFLGRFFKLNAFLGLLEPITMSQPIDALNATLSRSIEIEDKLSKNIHLFAAAYAKKKGDKSEIDNKLFWSEEGKLLRTGEYDRIIKETQPKITQLKKELEAEINRIKQELESFAVADGHTCKTKYAEKLCAQIIYNYRILINISDLEEEKINEEKDEALDLLNDFLSGSSHKENSTEESNLSESETKEPILSEPMKPIVFDSPFNTVSDQNDVTEVKEEVISNKSCGAWNVADLQGAPSSIAVKICSISESDSEIQMTITVKPNNGGVKNNSWTAGKNKIRITYFGGATKTIPVSEFNNSNGIESIVISVPKTITYSGTPVHWNSSTKLFHSPRWTVPLWDPVVVVDLL